jgi:hypothetical protein
MDQGPLVTEQIDAGVKLINAFDKYKPVQAAFWVKESVDGQWYLYLASDQIDDSNFDQAYGEILRVLGAGPHLWLDPFQVKVIGVDDQMSKAVLDLMHKYPGRMPLRYQGGQLGPVSIEEAYIYPIPVPTSA